MKWMMGAMLVGPLTLIAAGISSPATPATSPRPDMIASHADLSVMSYNIRGLPWPIATGRNEDLEKIGERLADLRRLGGQPHIVLLQEAFTDQAKSIGALGGYRYIVAGPSTQDMSLKTVNLPGAFSGSASWLKGETEGKWEDSGLLILSDYPVEKVERMAFPKGACAGYDCLANKGMVLAWVRVPGRSAPVAVVDTHLNSRHSSGVSDARANEAFGWQIEAARNFLKSRVPQTADLIFAGDLNIGHDADRIALAARDGGPLPGAADAIRSAQTKGLVDARSSASAKAIVERGKDWQYYRAGTERSLKLTRVSVPFGFEPDGKQLSDHMGYVAEYAAAD